MQHFGEQFGVKCSEREGPLVTIHHGQPAAKFSKARPLQRALHELLPGDLQQTNVAIFTQRRVVDLRKLLMASIDTA